MEMIVISPLKEAIVCLCVSGIKILSDFLYSNHRRSEKEERGHVVDVAGVVAAEDMHSMVYNLKEYPPLDNFFQEVESCIFNSLVRLFEIVIAKTIKTATKDKWIKKCIAIISAARSNSFLSPLLVVLQHLFKGYISHNYYFMYNIFF